MAENQADPFLHLLPCRAIAGTWIAATWIPVGGQAARFEKKRRFWRTFHWPICNESADIRQIAANRKAKPVRGGVREYTETRADWAVWGVLVVGVECWQFRTSVCECIGFANASLAEFTKETQLTDECAGRLVRGTIIERRIPWADKNSQ